jgi:hypothetical protein
MRSGKLGNAVAVLVCAAAMQALTGCMFWHHKAPPPAAPAPPPTFASMLKHPVNIEVVDQRPSEETVPDPTYASGYAYTTFDPPGQIRYFAAEVGNAIRQAKGLADYRNLNADQPLDPTGLHFTFFVRHWYAQWPLLTSQSPVPVDGEMVVKLQVRMGDELIYEQSYETTGTPTFADVSSMDKKNYAAFIPRHLKIKGNQLMEEAIKQIVPDLMANWATITGGEGN